MPCSRVNAIERPEVVDALALEARRARRGSGGSRWRGRGSAIASQKPPFRPLAPKATVSASRTTTRSAGSVSVRAIAVHRPVNPPPTIATSASSVRRRERRIGAARPATRRASSSTALGRIAPMCRGTVAIGGRIVDGPSAADAAMRAITLTSKSRVSTA